MSLHGRRRVWRCALLLLLLLGVATLVAWRVRRQERALSEPVVRYSTHELPLRKYQGPFRTPPFAPVANLAPRDPEGCLVFVTRTSSLTKVRRTMFDVEQRFNYRFRYPYIFLGEHSFSPEFQVAVRYASSGSVRFGLADDWWEGSAAPWASRMERYWAAPFARHPALAGCRFAWRLEPGSHHTCDVDQDPFALMRSRNLSYAFAVTYDAPPEPSPARLLPLLAHALNGSSRTNSLSWLWNADSHGATMRCQFLTNSELVDLHFVRSREYQDMFAAVDRGEGGLDGQWSDVSLRSLAVASLLDQRQVAWLDGAGYTHDDLHNCPGTTHRQMQCHCDPNTSTHLRSPCATHWTTAAIQINETSIATVI
ncbi:hypothetical protein H4R19_003637 [Coemansia spiralis]|nr:hypothetical protein H4R19_003637 [Coemansia spiralis]